MSDGHRVKRLRRLSTEEETEGSDAWIPSMSVKNTTTSARPRRAAAIATQTIIDRSSPEDRVPTRSTRNAPSKAKQAPVVRATRIVSGRQRRKPVVDVTSSEEEEEEEEEEEMEDQDDEMDEDDDAEGEEDDEEMVDAEGEEDEEMEDIPPPPPPPPVKGRAQPKPAAQAAKPPARSVAAPPVQPPPLDDSDDDELSSLGSLEEEEEEEDAEGEEVEPADEEMGGAGLDEEDEEDAEGESEEENDSDATPISGSPGGTPDLSRLTRRQRAQYEEYDGGLMALSNEAQKKKHLTAEEHAMRRAEMARRRKNLSEKRNEEEKMSTIDRLLKKQAPKRRRKIDVIDGTDILDDDGIPENRPPLGFIRIVRNNEGTTLAVPQEWLEAPVGELFVKTAKPLKHYPVFSGKMVEEID